MYYANIWKKGKPRHFHEVKGRTWTAMRKDVEAEMRKPDSLHWNTVFKMQNGQTLFEIGPSRTMKKFPLREP